MLFFSRLRKNKTTTNNLDQNLVLHLSKSRVPSLRQIKYLGKFLSPLEKWIIYTCLLIGLAGLIFISLIFYQKNIILTPDEGGNYETGLVGNPQYINPFYASLNDADADLEKLIYSRLFTHDNEGRAIPDLASEVNLSTDKKTYTIKLKTATWHNGEPVTADDVIFTFNNIIDPEYKSPLKDNFTGVSITKIDDQTISFTLQEPYLNFPRLLDFGIAPISEWDSVSPETIPLTELNIKPIGSGPFRFKSLTKSKDGTIRSYTVERNNNYYGNKPYLEEITFKFFPSQEEMIAALNNGQISGLNYLEKNNLNSIIAKNSLNYYQLALPELTAVFFNLKSKGVITDKKLRQALASLIDQNTITKDTVERWGIASQTILPSFVPGNDNLFKFDEQKAQELITTAGWQKRFISQEEIDEAKKDPKKQELAKITSGEWYIKEDKPLIIYLLAPEKFKNIAEKVAASWQKIGLKVETTIKPDEVIEKEILINKQFEILIYSLTLNQGDPYPIFNKNSQLNISGWENSEVNKILENARLTDSENAAQLYHRFLVLASEDMPLSPIFWQAYVYPQNKKLKGFTLISLEDPAQRLEQANQWYIKTSRKIKK